MPNPSLQFGNKKPQILPKFGNKWAKKLAHICGPTHHYYFGNKRLQSLPKFIYKLAENWLKNGQKWAHFRTWSLRIGLWAISVYPKNSKTMAQPISILSMVFELMVAVTNPSAALLYFDETQNVNP